MRQVRHIGTLLSITGLASATHLAQAADWPNWRGPNLDGISAETAFKTTWTEPPKVLWEYPVGSGFSSFACVDGKAYTCGTKDAMQVLFCFDADTGDVVWKVPIEKELEEHQGGDGTRATPAVNLGRVYIVGARGRLLCVNAKDGSEVWHKQFEHKPRWAYSGSVLIEGNLAIVSPGKSQGSLAAFDKTSGKEVWKCGNDRAGYSTPYPFTHKNKRYVVGFMAKSAIIADVKTGRQVCTIPWETDYDINASTPVYHNGHLFLSSGYNTGCALFKLSEESEKLAATKVWRSKVLMAKFRSCILKDGHLYSGSQEGDGLRCVEFMTGQQKWSVPRTKHASLLLAGDHFIVLTEKGKLMTAKVSPKEFEPLAEASILSGRCWTVPTLYNGKLYLRNRKRAVCLDLRPGLAAR